MATCNNIVILHEYHALLSEKVLPVRVPILYSKLDCGKLQLIILVIEPGLTASKHMHNADLTMEHRSASSQPKTPPLP